MTQEDDKLIISVSTRYAVNYAGDILERELSERSCMAVPEGYACIGTYTLDSVNDHTGAEFVFLGETDKNPLSYETSENVTFRVSLLADNRLVSAPNFVWEYETEDKTNLSDTEPGHSGQLILTLPGCKIPGVGKLTVSAANKKGVPLSDLSEIQFVGSVVFDFNNINVAVPEPDDFDEFWNEQMRILLATEPSAIEFGECEHCSNPNFYIYSAKVSSVGDPAYIHITVPKNAKPHSLKINVGFGAYGIYSMGPQFADNCITVSVNPHSIENDMDASYYEAASERLSGFGFDNESKETSYFLGMLQRDIQAIRFAENRFADLWNGVDIEVSGGSMGGFQSIAVAGLYDKVTKLNAGIPWMCDIGGNSQADRLSGWRPSYNEANSYYDSCYFAARVKCDTNISAGLGDYICPPSGITSLYNALTCNKTIDFKQNRGHGYWGGSQNKIYYLEGADPVIDPMAYDIKDTGIAVPAPDYSDNRVLNESEKQLKAAADGLRSEKFLKMTLGPSSSFVYEDFNAFLKERLVEKHGLSAESSVEIDRDSYAAFINEYTKYQDGDVIMLSLDYTLYDNNGGYYDSSVSILAKKDLASA